ncbi:MAG: GNAT family N-acetyltransferase, partial [Kiritimatiellae bacterium]|nr:GNAT family N-acetyltransferase [Kiritimatiellia bacterium]
MNVIETQRLCIRETAADNVTGEGLGRCILLLKSDGERIGRCWLSWRNHQGRRRLEVSCLLRREHRRKGYATEAVQGCLRFAFETLGVAEAFATIPGTHVAAMNVAIRCGMTIRGLENGNDPGLDSPRYVFAARNPNAACGGEASAGTS